MYTLLVRAIWATIPKKLGRFATLLKENFVRVDIGPFHHVDGEGDDNRKDRQTLPRGLDQHECTAKLIV